MASGYKNQKPESLPSNLQKVRTPENFELKKKYQNVGTLEPRKSSYCILEQKCKKSEEMKSELC